LLSVGIRRAERCFCLKCAAPKGKNREPGPEGKIRQNFYRRANPQLLGIASGFRLDKCFYLLLRRFYLLQMRTFFYERIVNYLRAKKDSICLKKCDPQGLVFLWEVSLKNLDNVPHYLRFFASLPFTKTLNAITK